MTQHIYGWGDDDDDDDDYDDDDDLSLNMTTNHLLCYISSIFSKLLNSINDN